MHHDGVAAVVLGTWQLALHQPQYGYRFSLDAFILADFVTPSFLPPQPILDLGTGCGVVALLLARRLPRARLVGIELQAELVALAQQNVVNNDLGNRIDVVRADVRDAAIVAALRPASHGGVQSALSPHGAGSAEP